MQLLLLAWVHSLPLVQNMFVSQIEPQFGLDGGQHSLSPEHAKQLPIGALGLQNGLICVQTELEHIPAQQSES
jgi:hypothetical protein